MAGASGDMPKFTSSSYTSTSTSAAALGAMGIGVSSQAMMPTQDWFEGSSSDPYANERRIKQAYAMMNVVPQEKVVVTMKSRLRIVRVFLVDPDERVPVEKRVLHRTEEITTDVTDQELYFGIAVQQLLSDHNAYRASIKWKEDGSKGEAEPLKEIRIRDLVMSVTTIAEFQTK